MSIRIIGVDPGLVHTGCVRLTFSTEDRHIAREFLVVDGLGMQEVADWIIAADEPQDLVFVERYRPRHNLSPDQEMLGAQRLLKQQVRKAVLLDNTGITKVVPQGLLQVLDLWDAPQRTHHQDLRSAARILLKGMMVDVDGNALLSDVVLAHLTGRGWEIGGWNS